MKNRNEFDEQEIVKQFDGMEYEVPAPA